MHLAVGIDHPVGRGDGHTRCPHGVIAHQEVRNGRPRVFVAVGVARIHQCISGECGRLVQCLPVGFAHVPGEVEKRIAEGILGRAKCNAILGVRCLFPVEIDITPTGPIPVEVDEGSEVSHPRSVCQRLVRWNEDGPDLGRKPPVLQGDVVSAVKVLFRLRPLWGGPDPHGW